MSLVEYHDPDDLFPLLLPSLFVRLPLRNLHWKSATRPLRSISSLQVDFVPDQETQERIEQHKQDPSDDAPESKKDAQTRGAESNTAAKPADGSNKVGPKNRRHQIPGLRQTPYLKVYLLRCDDSEAYKASSRKLLRDWIKDNVRDADGAASKNKQENHDAFEWLILHVVLPDTPAAGQPRWSKQTSADSTDLKEKPTGSTKWPGRGSTTILEKIRSDFNQTGKAAHDRVAQIRLQKEAVPTAVRESTSSTVGSAYIESPQESAQAWNDLISKFKALILMSFDLRVRQYEDDLREKDAQRSLPGWNFCTFFVLKEGLARAFESVGLIEDALIGYDELAAGLEGVIRESESHPLDNTSTAFQAFTKDLCEHFERSSRTKKDAQSSASDQGNQNQIPAELNDAPISSSKKDYRTLILSNNISIFDFECYVFSRQKALLLRQANLRLQSRSSIVTPNASASDLTMPQDSAEDLNGGENLIALAELCKRVPVFATTMARVMRADLQKGLSDRSVDVKEVDISTFISSWTFSTLQQILEETNSSSLRAELSVERSSSGQNASREDLAPVSRSSLPPRQFSYPLASNQVIYEDEKFSHSQDLPKEVLPTTKTALSEVAAHRADLLLLQRKHLERLAGMYGWSIHLADSGDWNAGFFMTPDVADAVAAALPVVENLQLRGYLCSSRDFEAAYAELTHHAIHHYRLAGRLRSSNMLVADLASLKFEEADYAAAASHFQPILDMFLRDGWNRISDSLLRKYAFCLKQLHRKDEYVRVLLATLAKSVAQKRFDEANSSTTVDYSDDKFKNWAKEYPREREGEFSELVAFSRELPYDLTVPMADYFDGIEVDSQLQHFDDRDGFYLNISFKPLIGDGARIDSLKLRLVDTKEQDSQEIWLESDGGFFIQHELLTMRVTSTITTVGLFQTDKVVLQAGKLAFVYDTTSIEGATGPLSLGLRRAATVKTYKPTPILIFPRQRAVEVDVVNSKHVQIGKSRSISVHLSCGDNAIERAKLHVRAASAGLRLRTANTEVVERGFEIEDKSKAGVLTLGRLEASSKGTFEIPYDTERSTHEIALRVEFSYTTNHGSFSYTKHVVVNIELTVDVNVQDIFQDRFILSKFFVRPIRGKTCWVLNTQLEGSRRYEAYPIASKPPVLLASSKQPVCATYKISPAEQSKMEPGEPQSDQRSLPLTVEYINLEEDIINQLSDKFACDVEASPIASFIQLVLPEFRRHARRQISPQQYELLAIVDHVTVPGYLEMRWTELLLNLHDPTKKLSEWLQHWHKENQIFEPSKFESALQSIPRSSRQLVIDFDIPAVGYLHTASLRVLKNEGKAQNHSAKTEVGQPLAAQLRIKYSRKWGASLRSSSSSSEGSEQFKQLFTYEIQANPEVWLVGGRRRETFLATENESIVFNKVLVPLRTGHLMLPLIDIKIALASHEDAENTRCETDCTSQGQSVMVLEGCSTITLGFGQEGHIGKGIAVLESDPGLP